MDVQHRRGELAMARARLHVLLVQEAGYGALAVPPHVVIEIADCRTRIAGLEAQLRAGGVDPATVTDVDRPPLHPDNRPSISTTSIDPERAKLIQLVTNLLDQSEVAFEHAVDLALGLTTMPRLVTAARSLHWGRTTKSRPLTEPVRDLVLRAQRLLIVGAPGAGKSATIRTLCRDLLPLAKNGRVPVPVIVNLASYGRCGGPVDRWLTEEGLPDSLGIAKKSAARLVGEGMILVLLDGLDEMVASRRAECITSLNAAIADGASWVAWLVVGCRRQDYDEAGVALAADAALEVQPLTAQAVKTALRVAGTPTRGLLTALDVDAELADLLTTPLAVTLAARAYADEVAVLVAGRTDAERWHTLYQTFVRRMLQRGQQRHDYALAKTLYWLRWLAQTMRHQTITVFFVERLDPSWLMARRNRWNENLVVGLIFVLISGLVAMLNLALGVRLIVAMVGGVFCIQFGILCIRLIIATDGRMNGGIEAYINHVAFRFLLWREGSAPLNYIRFLESCRALLFLRRRGGAYEFWHITLRDYLAGLTDDEIAALARDIDD